MWLIFLPFYKFVLFFTFPFLIIFNFYIIKKNHISKTFRDPPQIGSRSTSLGNGGLEYYLEASLFSEFLLVILLLLS
jgi:hypothetical protein